MTRTLPMLSALATAALLLVACGGGTPMTDSGTPDASPLDLGVDAHATDLGFDAGWPPGTTCDSPMVVTGDATAVVSATIDTSMGPAGMRDVGLRCGNPDPGMGAGRFPPQEVLEYHVAGTGLQRVDVTTVNAATSRMFDTVLQVRTTCTMVPTNVFPFSCFDDSGGTEVRSTGSVTVMGGTTLYVIVTGFTSDAAMPTTVDRGPVRVDFTQHAAHAPTATAVEANFVGSRFELVASGMDADGDAAGMIAHLKDAAGMPVDVTGDGHTDQNDDVILRFATSVAGMTTFSGSNEVAELVAAGMTAKSVLTGVHATQADVTVYDQGGLESAPMRATIVTIPEVDPGVMCDHTHRCWLPATCDATMMTCALPAPISTACTGATPLVVATPTTMTTTATTTGSIGMGTGQFNGSCGQGTPATATPGLEDIYAVDVPAGMFDLVVGTEASSPATTDTVLYVRSVCANPGTEVGCNDDIDTAGMDYRSHVEVLNAAAGTYAVFVEHWGGGAVSYSLHADLRPVLATGAACDGAGRMNRCAAGACPTSHVCP